MPAEDETTRVVFDEPIPRPAKPTMVITAESRFVGRKIAVPIPDKPGISQMRKMRILQQKWVVDVFRLDPASAAAASLGYEEWRDVPYVEEE